MAYHLPKTAPGASDLTAKNRVWGFFANSNKTRPGNRRQPQQPRRKNRPAPTKTAPGIPLWPSRDPIEENDGVNLYGFVGNNPVSIIDIRGLSGLVPHHLSAGARIIYDVELDVTQQAFAFTEDWGIETTYIWDVFESWTTKHPILVDTNSKGDVANPSVSPVDAKMRGIFSIKKYHYDRLDQSTDNITNESGFRFTS